MNWGLARTASSDLAMLSTHGRDTEESSLLQLKHDGTYSRNGEMVREAFGWVPIGRSTLGSQLTPERLTVISALDGRGPMSITDLAAVMGEEYDTARKQLARMADAGLIQQIGSTYSLIPL